MNYLFRGAISHPRWRVKTHNSKIQIHIQNNKKSAPFYFVIVCTTLSAYVSSAKDGILSIGILTLLFVGYTLVRHWDQSKRKISALVILGIAVALVFSAHARHPRAGALYFKTRISRCKLVV